MTLFPRERSTAFARTEFVAWDGEGYNVGKIDEWTEEQKYVLLSVSTGDSIYDENGLTFKQRLQFIAEMARKYPNATHVFFGGSYDFNKILEGLPREKVEELHRSKRWVMYGQWLFRYRPRKELVIAHLPDDIDEIAEEDIRSQCDAYIRFWDVIGFFQCSFLHAVKQWLGPDYPDYELIQSGKIERLTFESSRREFMEQYNQAETKALVEIMKRLHAQLTRLNLKLTRWDGAGAVAAEVFKRHALIDSYFTARELNGGEKPSKIELDPAILEATRYAYFGGRIESGRMGRIETPIYNYDINSAYPYAAAQLPNLNNGEWRRRVNLTREQAMQAPSLSMIRVRWYFHRDRLYYPLPFRMQSGAVIFPKEGERWLYAEEVKAALLTMREHDRIELLESWEFHEIRDDYPNTFAIVERLYAERQEMVRLGDPAEKVLKLGLNSIYGKLCQKLGWDQANKLSPRFHFLLFAGYITSYTRARIYSAIANDMEHIAAICTDGIISTRPLRGIIPSTDKGFGAWSLETNDELVQLQSGVYWLRKGSRWSEKARGLGRVVGEGETEEARDISKNEKILARIAKIESGWYSQNNRVQFPVKLFVTSKKALTGRDWFRRWGHWYELHDVKTGIKGRGLELLCTQWGKRRLTKPIRPNQLTDTVAAMNIEWEGPGDMGGVYELPWIDGDTDQWDQEELADE